jgi:coenzyme F420-0:L-glutamate ligase / coenzyme F420-1:gamma-L-glutamate ligase
VTLSAVAFAGLPEVGPGDDLAALIAGAAESPPGGDALSDDDVLVVAHKVVSKAEGRVRDLDEIAPTSRARELAARLDRDPRHVQAVLDESVELLREDRVLICRTRHGFVCANAGVDASNAGAPNRVVLLPEDPDGSARRLRAGLADRAGARPAVVVSDSFGRAWRHGQAEVAIGCAGLQPLDDWRGRVDSGGRELRATWIAVADQAAAAAELARSGKDAGEPVVIVRGLERFVTPADGPGAAALVRPREEDLFG